MKWPNVKLDSLCSVITKGTTPRTLGKEYVSSGIPFLRAENLQGDEIILNSNTLYIDDSTNQLLSRSVIQPGDVLISIAGTIGRSAIVPNNAPLMNCNQAVAIVRISGPLNHRFLLHWLKTSDAQFQMTGAKVTQTISNLSLTQIRNLQIPLPSLSEQRRIVEILDQADALRKKHAEADARAARILPALFYKMFGDPATNPKGWKIKPLSEQGAFVRYGLGQPPKGHKQGVPLIRATNISRGSISPKNMLFVDPEDVPPSRNAFLKADEVLVVRSGAYTGDVAQVTEEWEGAVAGYDLVVTPGKSLTGEFLEAFFLTPFIQDVYFKNLKTRAGQPHLNVAQLSATPIFVIPKEKQEQFANFVRSIRRLMKLRKKSLTNLDRLFDVLLHRAFTGDLTAQWREAYMKELLAEMEEQAKALNNIGVDCVR